MPHYPDSPAATWRDLAGELTVEKRVSIEQIEAEGGVPQQELLEWARDYIDYHLADMAYGDVPVPPGARTDSSGWCKNSDGEGYSRSLVWQSYDGPAEVTIQIDGRQECGGDFTRRISLWGSDGCDELSSAQAREMAALLIRVADDLDRLQ